MKYWIEICLKYAQLPSNEDVQAVREKMHKAIVEYYKCAEHESYITYPTSKHIEQGTYTHYITLSVVTYMNVGSKFLFDMLQEIHPIIFVNVQDARYVNRGEKVGFYWLNEGETTYHDGGTYVDSNYDFYVNDTTHYTVQDVAVICARPTTTERTKKAYKDLSYVWSTTASWDNPLKAKNREDALAEFEEYYYDMLWRSVESAKERLNTAMDNFIEYASWRRKNR